MFSSATSFNQDINTKTITKNDGSKYEAWNVSNVTDMSSMFDHARTFNQDLSRWDVSGVTNMSYMFLNASSLNQDLSAWKVSIVTDMRNMFENCPIIYNIPSWYNP